MKSPADLAQKLSRQWQRATERIERLLTAESWPLELSIGKPSAHDVQNNTVLVLQHVQRWRAHKVGEVIFAPVIYRSTDGPIEIPVCWRLRSPSEWVKATADQSIAAEFAMLEQIVAAVNPLYRELFIAERALWRHKSSAAVIATAALADALFPGAAQGRPLRLLAEYSVDTKFIERHARLLQRLLDQRYDGAATEQGLLPFLDALDDADHWLLVRPLAEELLPFKRLQLTACELAKTPLPAQRIILIENKQCEHLLPELADAIAILGAGFNLNWLSAAVFNDKQLFYWGDMDTWGLLMLARARILRPNIQPLMMNQQIFSEFAAAAVAEPVVADEQPPLGLSPDETEFYRFLRQAKQGRLEQEFISVERVHAELALALAVI